MIRLYEVVTTFAWPATKLLMSYRVRKGKEERRRIRERFGEASVHRPTGPLVWIHAASVGEANSILPLIGRFLDTFSLVNVLITTGTVSSAQILENKLSSRLVHQFLPIDRPREVRAFLDYWRPDLAIWVESELWPNLVSAVQGREILTIIVQGRMSAKSFRRWSYLKWLIAPLLAGFNQVLVQTSKDADRYRTLGARAPIVTGTLKYSSPPLVVDHDQLKELKPSIIGRPCWVAASVHPGEFDILCRTHILLKKEFGDLLTIIVPRHPTEGTTIKRVLDGANISCALRSSEELITESIEVYIGDSLGELSIFYSLVPIAFIGGSFIPHGGQNPLEAIQLECATIVGPNMFNFAEIVADLRSQGSLVDVSSAEQLSAKLSRLIQEPELARSLLVKQKAAVSGRGMVLDQVFVQILESVPKSMRLSWG